MFEGLSDGLLGSLANLVAHHRLHLRGLRRDLFHLLADVVIELSGLLAQLRLDLRLDSGRVLADFGLRLGFEVRCLLEGSATLFPELALDLRSFFTRIGKSG